MSAKKGVEVVLHTEKMFENSLRAIELSKRADESKAKRRRESDNERLSRSRRADSFQRLGATASEGLLMALDRITTGEVEADDELKAWAIHMINKYGRRLRPEQAEKARAA